MTMTLGVALSRTLIIVSIALFARYAVKTPGVQSLAYLWGVTNGWFAFAAIVGVPDSAADGIPVLSSWLGPISRLVVNPPLDPPADWTWLTPEFIGYAWWAIAGLVLLYSYLRLAKTTPLLQRAGRSQAKPRSISRGGGGGQQREAA